MVLKEVQDVLANVVGSLPLPCNITCRTMPARHIAQAIVHAYLVVKIIEACCKIRSVLVRVVHFANENDVGILRFYLFGGILPKLMGHHLCHIAAETINSFSRPEQQHVGHLVPSIGYWFKMGAASAPIAIINTVVQLDRFVPIVGLWVCIEPIVARATCHRLGVFSRHFV